MLCVWTVACGDNAGLNVDANTIDAIPRQTVSAPVMLDPGMLVEGFWMAGPDDQIGLGLDTSVAALDWDIHAHQNGGTQEVVYGFAQVTIRYDFQPTEQAQWYLLLRNGGTTSLSIDVHMDLFGNAQWGLASNDGARGRCVGDRPRGRLQQHCSIRATHRGGVPPELDADLRDVRPTVHAVVLRAVSLQHVDGGRSQWCAVAP